MNLKYFDTKTGPNVPLIIITIVLLVVFAILWPFYTVPTGSRGVITQYGKIVGIEGEGLAVLPPWRKLSVFSIRAEQADVEGAEGATSDTQPVQVSLTVRYAINTDKVGEVYEQYSHNGDLSSYVQTAVQEVFKAVTAKYTAPDLISQRAKVSADIRDSLSTKLALYGAHVVNIDMRTFSFSKEYMAAINDKVTQEQKQLAAEKKLLTVESEQKQKVAVAEADANAVKATADGEAYRINKEAEAQANAVKVNAAALASAQGSNVLELKRIAVEQTKAERWNGALPQSMYAGAPMPFLNMGK